MERSIRAVILGTFTLRFSSGLTGALLVFYLARLHTAHGGPEVNAFTLGVMGALFYIAELVLSPFFGVFSDRLGHRRVMQFGPIFGAIAVIMTGLTTDLFVLGTTRWLEGASTAASIPSILGFLAVVTANDERLRGQVSARFEAATVAGLGAGIAVAGPMYLAFGANAFFINAVFYIGSLLIYRYGVADPEGDAPRAGQHGPGFRRYMQLLRSSHVWLLAPTWIAINAAIGLWVGGQSIFQLVKQRDPRFQDQLLMGGFGELQVTAGIVVAGVVFFAGIKYWGDRFRKYRRTTIILYGILGGAAMVAAGIALNHSATTPAVLQIGYALVLAVGLFVLAGATPAALGLLADISEAFPRDRGAIMGLYSVFLAIGQIIGHLVGGEAASLRGIDGMFVATLILLGVALLPLFQLRLFEHRFTPGPGGPQPSAEQLGAAPD